MEVKKVKFKEKADFFQLENQQSNKIPKLKQFKNNILEFEKNLKIHKNQHQKLKLNQILKIK